MFSVVLSVILFTGSYLTIAHDALDLTIQGSSSKKGMDVIVQEPTPSLAPDPPQAVALPLDMFKLVHCQPCMINKSAVRILSCFLVILHVTTFKSCKSDTWDWLQGADTGFPMGAVPTISEGASFHNFTKKKTLKKFRSTWGPFEMQDSPHGEAPCGPLEGGVHRFHFLLTPFNLFISCLTLVLQYFTSQNSGEAELLHQCKRKTPLHLLNQIKAQIPWKLMGNETTKKILI